MTKALIRKQLMEVFAWLYRNSKTGKNRTATGSVMFGLLYLVIFCMLGGIFFAMADSMCAPLVSAGLGWFYIAIMSLVGLALGVFGSVFNTAATLYGAKDNDILLAMPVPPSRILLVRLCGVYLMGLLYELIVMVPTVIVFIGNAKIGAFGIAFTVLMPFILSVVVLVLSCILGFFVTLIGKKLKNKSYITVLLSIVFIALYYYVYTNAMSLLQSIITNAASLGAGAKIPLYLFYQMGLACEGKAVSALISLGIVALIFYLVYLVLERSYIRIVTTDKGEKEKEYREKKVKAASSGSALLRKEFRRFTSSANYMLNCGLGVVLMVIAAVALLIKGSTIIGALNSAFGDMGEIMSLFAAAAICLAASMNDITAPSVSLEGKSIWIYQSLPVTTRQVLAAKLKMHMLLTVPPVLLLSASFVIVVKPGAVIALLMTAAAVLFVLFTALIGLFLNLKMPNLNWTNEIYPIKQSASVMLTLFGGWGIVVALGIVYFFVKSIITPTIFLLIVSLVMAGLCFVLWRWISRKGAEIFSRL